MAIGGAGVSGIVASFSGQVVFDPEQRFGRDGTPALQFVIEVRGERLQPGTFPSSVRVSCWADLAEELTGQLERGASVACEGRLTLGKWTGRDGQPKAGLNLSARSVEILGQVGRRTPAPDENHARPILAPASPVGRPAGDDLPDFDSPPIRLSEGQRRIAKLAEQGAQRAATRPSWRR